MNWRSHMAYVSRLVRRVRVLPAYLKLANLYLDESDSWSSVPSDVPLSLLSPNCHRDLAWYFDGKSELAIHTVSQVCEWLAECEYVSDQELFRVPDFWQHPITFEKIRKGDCEDHALWAWRRLCTLGYRARFMLGEYFPEGADGWGGHAWVMFEDGGKDFVLESVAHETESMICPLADVRCAYTPHYSVDQAFELNIYAGIIETLFRRRRSAKRKGGQGHSGMLR